MIVGVSCDDDKHAVQKVKDFIQKSGMNYVVVMGDEDVQAAFGGMDAIPTTFIIDRSRPDSRPQGRRRARGRSTRQVILKYLK